MGWDRLKCIPHSPWETIQGLMTELENVMVLYHESIGPEGTKVLAVTNPTIELLNFEPFQVIQNTRCIELSISRSASCPL